MTKEDEIIQEKGGGEDPPTPPPPPEKHRFSRFVKDEDLGKVVLIAVCAGIVLIGFGGALWTSGIII